MQCVAGIIRRTAPRLSPCLTCPVIYFGLQCSSDWNTVPTVVSKKIKLLLHGRIFNTVVKSGVWRIGSVWEALKLLLHPWVWECAFNNSYHLVNGISLLNDKKKYYIYENSFTFNQELWAVINKLSEKYIFKELSQILVSINSQTNMMMAWNSPVVTEHLSSLFYSIPRIIFRSISTRFSPWVACIYHACRNVITIT